MTGNVTIFDFNGNPLKHFRYMSRPDRNQQLESIKFLYGKNFNSCYYEILPNVSAKNIHEDGVNHRAPSKRKRMSGKYLSGHPKIIRPLNISYPMIK